MGRGALTHSNTVEYASIASHVDLTSLVISRSSVLIGLASHLSQMADSFCHRPMLTVEVRLDHGVGRLSYCVSVAMATG